MRLKSTIKHIAAKIYDVFHQKTFVTENKNKIHYLIKKSKNKSNRLIVIFSGFNGHYVKGRFNYILTLKQNNDNQLFIKDDSGFCSVGTYYLGNGCSIYKEDGIIQLVNSIIKKLNVQIVITAGSSKGGTCSLLYGLKIKAQHIIVGSPQYKIASYLENLDGNDYGKEVLKPIIDTDNGFNFDRVDSLIKDEILNSSEQLHVYLYYSSKEPSWKRDVSKMVSDLEASSLQLTLTDLKIEKHDDIGTYMKKNLIDIINNIKKE